LNYWIIELDKNALIQIEAQLLILKQFWIFAKSLDPELIQIGIKFCFKKYGEVGELMTGFNMKFRVSLICIYVLNIAKAKSNEQKLTVGYTNLIQLILNVLKIITRFR
jgi:hypothetical protein